MTTLGETPMTATSCVCRTTSGPACSEKWKRPECGLRQLAGAVLTAALISLPVLGGGGWLMYENFAEIEADRVAFEARLQSYDRLVAAAPLAMLPVDRAAHGRDLFEANCSACHKADGTGVDG